MTTIIGMKKLVCDASKTLKDFGFTDEDLSRASAAFISSSGSAAYFTLDGSAAALANGHPIEKDKTFRLNGRGLLQVIKLFSGAGVTVTVTLII